MNRYRRQISLIGEAAQKKLLDAHVAVVGAGGLGSPALLYLAGAGVGRITVIDDDTVATSNLHRQVVHREASVGVPKVDSAAEQLRALNSEVTVDVVNERLAWPAAVETLRGADVVLDGSDNFDTRHVVSHACARLGVPHVWASILGHEAQLSVFWAGHGPVYEDLFPAPPGVGVVPSCAEAGVLGPVVGMAGSAMAMEAIKLITGVGSPLIGTLAYLDSLAGRWEYVPVTGDPEVTARVRAADPPAQEPPTVREIPAGAALIDVREPHEFAAGALDGAVNVPLSAILDSDGVPGEVRRAVDKHSDVVVYCAAGARSARAVTVLAERGLGGLVSLRGGLEGR